MTGSVSALFAQQLMHNGYAGAQEIVSVVFMLIATTVILIIALLTGPLARAFGVSCTRIRPSFSAGRTHFPARLRAGRQP